MKMNENYSNLQESYLFSTIAKKVTEYTAQNPDKEIIRLGIGDVTLPLVAPVIKAMHEAADEMAQQSTFKGYGPEQGYGFLKDEIVKYYKNHGVVLSSDEVFISDGAKSDLANILDIFSTDNTVLVTDPVYPVYVDTNIMAGRKILYAKATKENNFLPMPDNNIKPDIIYLCSPNNPTGAVYDKTQLTIWVNYANENNAVLLFDAAYEAFISEDMPHSIFEINGANLCAIEFCSLSKTAGFTGTRCGYTVVPKELSRNSFSLNKMWLRRQTTKFNGVPYVIQKAAAAIFSEEGQAAIKENIEYYKNNSKVIANALDDCNCWYSGGINSPYLWMQCPKNMPSWDFFDYLLNTAGVVGTPGAGFGECGEGYFRLTAFGDAEKTKIAAERLKKAIKAL